MTVGQKNKSAQEIEVRAAEWAVVAERGSMSEQEERELNAWLASDPRHLGAYARMRAISDYSKRAAALGATFQPADFRTGVKPDTRYTPSKRQLLWGGAAIAAGLGGAVAFKALQLSWSQTYETDRGQMRVVTLADGSVVNMNTDSRMKVHHTSDRRSIQLERGEAVFDVAKDPLRPFIVKAGEIEVIAVGTSFVVQHLDQRPVQVLVREGTVKVDSSSQGTPIVMTANMRAEEQPGEAEHKFLVKRTPPEEIDRLTDWRDGHISFEGETLDQASREFARYSDVKIVIDDRVVGQKRVSGRFHAVDPVGFAKAVAVTFDLKADVEEKKVRLHR